MSEVEMSRRLHSAANWELTLRDSRFGARPATVGSRVAAKSFFLLGFLLFAPSTSLFSATHSIDFNKFDSGSLPDTFRSTVTAEGKPTPWRIVDAEVPPAFPPLTPQAPKVDYQRVLAQTGGLLIDEHFPLLIYEEQEFGDFTLTTRFKLVDGLAEQMAGIAFRLQDENNYYVLRASGKGNSFYFYKFVDGQRHPPIGESDVPIATNTWHTLTVECYGNRIRCRLNDKEIIPPLTDHSFRQGKIGFWTKSDSVSYFGDTKIEYTPITPPGQQLVDYALKKYTKVLDLKVYTFQDDSSETRVAGSKDPADIGQPGGEVERNVIVNGETYFGKKSGKVIVTMPLDDRNGAPVAAVRIVMDSFFGQTEQNAVSRALPIIRYMQQRIRWTDEL